MIKRHNTCKEIHYMKFTTNDTKLIPKYKLIWNKRKKIIENDFSTHPINEENNLDPKLKSIMIKSTQKSSTITKPNRNIQE